MEQPAQTLVHEAVTLRRWQRADAFKLFPVVIESLDHLRPWMPWAQGYDLGDATGFLAKCEEEWTSGAAFNYAITTHERIVGSCGLMRRIGVGGMEIGYWLHPAFTGRGLVSRAATALTQAAFRLPDVDRVEIRHDAANTASGAVPERLGFREVTRYQDPKGPEAPACVGTWVVWRLTRDAPRPAD